MTITRPYQCGIAVYQLAKLRMLEFYYDFVDKFCDRRDFEVIQMDTDSLYMALTDEDFDEIIRPELKELYKDEKPKWLVTDEYSKRVPGLFKPEFKGKRVIALTSKCYFAERILYIFKQYSLAHPAACRCAKKGKIQLLGVIFKVWSSQPAS